MTDALASRVAATLDVWVASEVSAIAADLAREAGARAVLFYGSNLRTGSLEGVLDFYVLLPGPQRERVWPRVSYREWTTAAGTLRAKIATMAFATFARAADGRSRDTTIWARFVQPSALVWTANEAARSDVIEAVGSAARTAAGLAAALGPEEGPAEEYWRALFRATYRAEFRVEQPGREDAILAVNAAHFEGLLPLAWKAQGITCDRAGDTLRPAISTGQRARILRWWRQRAAMGKPLNLLRLSKASTTFEGAAAYAAWKIERHTGVRVAITPWRERHPFLAAPGVLWQVWRARRRS